MSFYNKRIVRVGFLVHVCYIRVMNEFYFQIEITPEQIEFANALVDYSIKNHPVKDIFANDPGGAKRKREFRQTGTLGEVVFADMYGLPRPTRSFGAIDGQDYGQDFTLVINGQEKVFDIKAMRRKNNVFRGNYVLNLPKYQMLKKGVITDNYFCISIHEVGSIFIASFIGWVDKVKVENGEVGILYESGTRRVKDNGDSFVFMRDTYEVEFRDICSPPLNEKIRNTKGFQIKKILPPLG